MRVRATLAYDGAPFHGFAANAGVPTVAGLLVEVLTHILRDDVVLTCAGRTDRGVHAVGQVVGFDLSERSDLELETLQSIVNRRIGPSVLMTAIQRVGDDFDARFSATGRTYRYRILDRPSPDPFLVSRAWHVPVQLDLAAMEVASAHLVGLHDFTSFCLQQAPQPDGSFPTMIRRVTAASWRRVADGLSGVDLLEFEVAASAFCQRMVRTIVGTLVAIGRGDLASDQIPIVLAAMDRRAAGDSAPPQGLIFWSAQYD
ncbi:MAG: tRNA pseudouridine(38-40) synthase TruA [Acidimicrobiales bacterium]|nr:tRNA pseudouridine(38-40) synthase TruA [Acidimicrobiales bacterium]